MDVSDLLSQPESKTLEFKRDLSSLTPIIKTIVAFANTAGGTLIIGRDSDGELRDVEKIFLAEERIANAIASSIRPPMLPDIEVATVNGKNLLVIRVSHWKGPFYLKKLGKPEGVYMRLGSTSRPAGPELLANLQRALSNTYYDELPIPELSKEDLDLEDFARRLESRGKTLDGAKLESMGILVKNAAGLVPSIGAVILFGRPEIRGRFASDARVSCARFLTSDRTHFLDRFEVEGSILTAVEQVPKFIARNTRLAAEIKTMQRRDIPEYPEVAVREALINALVHTDYSLIGSRIHVAVYSDHLEIQNPGMLPLGYTMEDLRIGVSRLRNKVIARVFRELGFIEEWGTSYKRIREFCIQEGYPEPEWHELSTTMRVIFQPHPATLTSRPVSHTTLRPDERRQAILDLLSKRGKLSVSELHGLIGDGVSLRVLKADLTYLKKQDAVALEGRGKSAVWHRTS